jgi:hypothetical protein
VKERSSTSETNPRLPGVVKERGSVMNDRSVVKERGSLIKARSSTSVVKPRFAFSASETKTGKAAAKPRVAIKATEPVIWVKSIAAGRTLKVRQILVCAKVERFVVDRNAYKSVGWIKLHWMIQYLFLYLELLRLLKNEVPAADIHTM